MFLSNFIHKLSAAIAEGITVDSVETQKQQKYSENIKLAIYASLIVTVPIITIWLSYSLLTLAINLVWLNLALKFGDQFLKQWSKSVEAQSKIDAPLHLKLYHITTDLLQNAAVPTILLASYVVGIPLLYLIGCSFLCYHLGLGNRKIALEIICAVDNIVTSLLLNVSNLFIMLFPQFRIELVAEYFHKYLHASQELFANAQIYIDRAICRGMSNINPKQQKASSKGKSSDVTASTDKTDDLISRGLKSGVRTFVGFVRKVTASAAPSTPSAKATETKHSRNWINR